MYKMKRALAMILALIMILSEVPAAFADTLVSFFDAPIVSEPVTYSAEPDSGDTAPQTAGEYFDSLKGGLVAVSLKAQSANTDEDTHNELIGTKYRYVGKISFQNYFPWRDPVTGVRQDRLFGEYSNVLVRIKAPEGITLVDGSGAVLNSDEGWVTVFSGSVQALEGSTVDRDLNVVYAVMDGNGSTASRDYDKLQVRVDMDVELLPDMQGEHEVKKITDADLTEKGKIANDTAMHGTASGKWTVRKTPEAGLADYSKYVKVGENTVTLTYKIEAGKDSNGKPDGSESAYVGYGKLDIASLTITDVIEPVTDKNGNALYPSAVKVLKDGTDITDLVSLSENKTGFTIDETMLNVLDGSATKQGTDVKAYTAFTVELTYPKENFTYPLTVEEAGRAPFRFTDRVAMEYTTKDGNAGAAVNDSASIDWFAVAGGGNIAIHELFFLSEDDKTGTAFSEFYQFSFGDSPYVSYKLIRCDENGEPMTGIDAWSKTIDLTQGNNGSVSTSMDKTGLKDKVPVGYVKIVPDYSAMDTNWVKAVSDKNENNAPESIIVAVKEGETSVASFGLRYIDGGFVKATKELYDASGAKVTDAAALQATQFVFTNKSDPSETFTLKIGADGKGTLALRPGEYSVKEVAPAGYAPAKISDITIGAGTEVALNNGQPIKNYPSEVTVLVKGKLVDSYVSSPADGDIIGATEVGAVAKTLSASDFSVEQKDENGNWIAVTATAVESSDGLRFTLSRVNNNAEPIEYRVVYSGTDALANSVDGSNDMISETETSVDFTFDGGVSRHDVNYYYQRYGTIEVVKVLEDGRTDSAVKPGLAGWKMSVADQTVETDDTGKASVGNLVMRDATGAYLTYAVEELAEGESFAKGDWEIAYSTNGTDFAEAATGGQQVAFSAGKDKLVVTVRNTEKVGTVSLKKTDDVTGTALSGAKFRVYTMDASGNKQYVKSELVNGVHAFGTEDDAAEYVTGNDGTFTVDCLESGKAYFAVETEAPDRYFLPEDAEVSLGTPAAGGVCSQVTVTNTHKPELKLTKYAKYIGVNGATADITYYADDYADFALYIKVGGTYVPAEDANGNAITFHLTKSGNSFVSGYAELEAFGSYALLETDNSGHMVTPDVKKFGNQPTFVQGKMTFFGPYEIAKQTQSEHETLESENKYRFTITDVTDYANTSPYTLKKRDALTNLEVSDLTGMTYFMMVQLPTGDKVKNVLLKNWGTESPVTDLPAEVAPARDGYTWYYSPVKTASDEMSGWIPWADSDGNVPVYKIVEVTPPSGYNNAFDPVTGTVGNTVSVLEMNTGAGGSLSWSGTFVNEPEWKITVSKTVSDVWNIVTGNEQPALLPGVGISLYVIENGVLQYYCSGMTGSDGTVTFAEKPLDHTMTYVAVETNSAGYDTWFDKNAGMSGGAVAIDDPTSLNGQTVDALKAAKLNYVVFGEGPSASEDGTLEAFGLLKNYDPYFQIKLHKFGLLLLEPDKYPEDAGKTEYPGRPGYTLHDAALNQAKFKLYTIPAADYAAVGNDPAQAIASGKAKTDGIVYETGMTENGEFITENLRYNAGLVYILKEIQSASGYSMFINADKTVDQYTVVMPDDYRTASDEYRNGVYSVEAENWTRRGGGPSYLRRFNVEIDKYVDVNNTGKFDDGDKELADVVFSFVLADKTGRRVFENASSDPFSTEFVTGTDKSRPSFAQSETFRITKDTLAGIAGVIGDDRMNSVFTFYYDGDDRRSYRYADFVSAKFTSDETWQEGDLDVSKFEIGFKLLLTEEQFPANMTPFNLTYLLDIKTVSGTFTNKEYTVAQGNPILNVTGKYVFAQSLKYTDDAKTVIWVPQDDSDYVEYTYTYIRSYAPVAEPIDNVVTRIDSSNYNDPPVAYLSPDSDYYVTETHAPKGYDKPVSSRVQIRTGSVETRLSADPDVRVQKVRFTDTPYITFTVHKIDGVDTAGLAGKQLKIEYATDVENYDRELIGPNGKLDATETTVTTDASGNAVFTLPKYDYRTAGYTFGFASYIVKEVESGKTILAFDVMNGTKTLIGADTASGKTYTVGNPVPGDFELLKQGTSDVTAPLSGVSFALSYAPFTSHDSYVNKPAAVPTSGWENLGTFTSDENGKVSFKDMKTGFYKLVETIPQDYIYEGKTFTTEFIFVSEGDAATLKTVDATLAGKYWDGTTLTVLKSHISDKTMDAENGQKNYNTVAAEDSLLTLNNTHKGYLTISKAFPVVTDMTAVPAKLVFVVKNEAGAIVADNVEVTIDAADHTGSVTLLLDPGTYTVTEKTAKSGAFVATATVTGSVDAANDKAEFIITPANGDPVSHTVSGVVLTQANTADKAVSVSYTNRTAKMRVVADKVDDEEEPNKIKGAGFVLFYEDTDAAKTKYYYAGIAANGLGTYTTDINNASIVETDENGVLTFDFVAPIGLLTLKNIDDAFKFVLTEVKADEHFRSLVERAEFTVKLAYENSEYRIENNKALVDGTGLTFDIILHGRTYDHATDPDDTKDTPLVEGAVFKLYRRDINGAGHLVASFTKDGKPYTSVTTDENGAGRFTYLDLLNANEQYVLVEESAATGYHDPSYYETVFNGDTALQTQSVHVDGKDLKGHIVFIHNEQSEGQPVNRKTLHIYNMPVSKLLILKYDQDYPKAETPAKDIPVNATFDVELNGGKDTYNTRVAINQSATAEIADAVADRYTYHSGIVNYYSDDKADYSFAEVTGLKPGTYTVTETGAADHYFYTPQAKETDPWYPIRTVEIDDDGGISVVSFANVPNPKFNDLDIKKTVKDMSGIAEGGKLGNLQETFENGEWQSITYTISDFAPAWRAGDPTPPDAVKYPMSKLYLTDIGQTFYDGTGSSAAELDNVVSRVKHVIVGRAYYTDNENAPMNVALYGRTDDGTLTLIGKADVHEGEHLFRMPETTDYSGFEVVYGEGYARIEKNFKAEPVEVSMEMLQKDDPAQGLVAKLRNNVRVAMGYDIGIDSSESTFTIGADAVVNPDSTLKLPKVSIKKTEQVKQNGVWSIEYPNENAQTMYVRAEDAVRYKVVLKNTDAEFSLPDPFVCDVMPASIDVTAVSATTTSSTLELREPAAEDGYAFVRTSGNLMPGESVTLVIDGTVNTAKALETTEIKNSAFGGSEKVIGLNKKNPSGAPFVTELGTAPTEKAPDKTGFGAYAAVKSEASAALATDADISIAKLVAGEVTDGVGEGHNYMSGSSHVAITNSEGAVFYKIVVTAGSPIAAGGLRVADILPYTNDKSVSGTERYSEFGVTEPSAVSVKVNGTPVAHTLKWSASADPAVYQNALNKGASGWSDDAEGAKGFFVQIDENIAASEANKAIVEITFTCKAPKAVVYENGKPVYNYYRQAVNNATARLTANAEGIFSNSNSVYVTVLPKQEATIGNRVWLDMNANGRQDNGEPDFKPETTGGVSLKEISLRAFVNSDTVYTTGAPKSWTTGIYEFGGLKTALKKSLDTEVYDGEGNVKFMGLNSNNMRYTYQLVVDPQDIPDGYVVSPAYAMNGGKATTFDVVADQRDVPVYSENTGDGHKIDSDFRLKDGKYVSSRFYLPMMQNSTGHFTENAEYLNFDLGLIRVRDLKIYKTANDYKLVEGAVFKVYGPFDSETTALTDEMKAAKLVATLTTDKYGTAQFTSSQDAYINYYQYYTIVEESVPAPYKTELLSIESNTANATLAAKGGNVVVLKPASGSDSERGSEVITLQDTYYATGKYTKTFEKKLTDKDGNALSIADPFFKNGRFSFTVETMDEAKDPNFGEAKTFVNDGATAGKLELSYSFGELLSQPKVYKYKVTEEPVVIDGKTPDAFVIDPSVYIITLTIADENANGKLTITETVEKKVGETTETVESKAVVFTNRFMMGDLAVSKKITGTPASASESFTFRFAFTAPEGLEGYLYGRTLDTASSKGTTGKLTIGADGKASLSIADGETVTILGLPEGTAYTVSEDDYSAKGYVTDYAEGDATAGTIDAEADETITVVCNNTRTVSGLTLMKVTEGTGKDKLAAFVFNGTLTYDKNTDLTIAANLPQFSGTTAKTTGSIKSIDHDQHTVSFEATVASGEALNITNILKNTAYTVTEADYTRDGYLETKIDGTVSTDRKVSGTITDADTSVTYTYANVRNAGSLKVEKALAGNASESTKDFSFTVKLERKDNVKLDGTYSTGSGTLKFTANADGSATSEAFKLKGGESLTIADIPTGTTYTVTEADYSADGYVTKIADATGTVGSGDDELVTVTATNTRNLGALTVEKKLADGSTLFGANDTFEITVTLTAPAGREGAVYGRSFAYSVNGTAKGNVTVDATAHTFKLNLKAGEKASIAGLPSGTQYSVEETNALTEKGYQAPAYENAQGEIPAEDSASATVDAVVTNTREAGSLLVKKTLAGNASDEAKEFTFTVTLTAEKKEVPVSGTYSIKKTDAKGVQTSGTLVFAAKGEKEATATFKLKGSESLEIVNILAGTKVLTEEANYGADGYVTGHSGAEAEIEANVASETEFTNTRNLGVLTVEKKLTDGSTLFGANDTFEVTVTLTAPAGREGAVYGRSFAYSINGVAKGNVTVDATAHTFKLNLKAGEKASIAGLPSGTQYSVEETNALTEKGYQAPAYENAQGEIPAEDSASATVDAVVTNTREAGSLLVKKTLAGNASDEAKEFTFTVTLTAEKKEVPVSGTYSIKKTDAKGVQTSGTLVFAAKGEKEATATFKLKGSESLEIVNILAGTVCLVEETDYSAEGYVTTGSGTNITVEKNLCGEAEIINTRNAGTVSVSKETAGTGKDKVNTFGFTVVLTYPDSVDLTQKNNKPELIGTAAKDASYTVDSAAHTVTVTASIGTGKTLKITNIVTDIDNPTLYEIVEEDYASRGYFVTEINGVVSDDRKAAGGVESITENYAHTYTNVRDSGNLVVEKLLDGNAYETERAFEFTVVLTNPLGGTTPFDATYATVRTLADGSEVAGKLRFESSAGGTVATSERFTLKGNEQLKILDILTGVSYLVTETDPSEFGYLVQETDTDGLITDGDVKATITNTRNLGQLSVTKELGGNAPRAIAQFEITVTLSRNDDLPIAGTYSVGNTGSETITFRANGARSAVATFMLAGGETMLINGIYEGTRYTVSERDYTYEGYETGYVGETGVIPVNATVRAVVTNTRNSGSLTIAKTVETVGMAIPDTSFAFTVSLTRPNGAPYTGTLRTTGSRGNGRVTFVNGVTTVSLRHGESVTIQDILVGSVYDVAEQEYTNVETVSEGTAGEMTTDGAIATFVNKIPQVYTSLKVVKVFEDKDASKRPDHVKVRVSNRDGEVGTYELSDANNWTVTIEDLPRYAPDGREYVYSVLELDVPEKYRVTYSGNSTMVVVKNTLKDTPFEPIFDDPLAKGGGLNLNEGYCFD